MKTATPQPVPVWFMPTMVVLAGMVLFVLAGAPRDPASPTWLTSLAGPTELRLFGAVIIGLGVYWGVMIFQSHRRQRRGKRR